MEYFFYLIIAAIFHCLYCLVAVHGTKKTYIFFGISELILVWLFFEAISIDIAYAGGMLVVQIALVIFIVRYNKNKQRKKIYDTVSRSEFTVFMFSGIASLKDEQYQSIQTIVDKTISIQIDFSKKVYLLSSYANNKLAVKYIFSKKQDCEMYIEYVERNTVDIQKEKEVEYVGKGATLGYTYDV